MHRQYILGKVFISHSSLDKPFVRRLAKALWGEGYGVWLDEKELVPGDALAQRLSDALSACKVVVVIVSKNSLRSRWLAFELNKATERMVKGGCRIIPALRGGVELPPELRGLLYADFRKSFDRGFKRMLAALEREESVVLQNSWAELPALLGEVFDFEGSASAWGEYDSWDFDFVHIDALRDPATGDSADIVYDIARDHLHRKQPLGTAWWDEYLFTRSRHAGRLFLVVSERPVSLGLSSCPESSAVSFHIDEPHFAGRLIVVADISDASDNEAKRAVLKASRNAIFRLATERGIG